MLRLEQAYVFDCYYHLVGKRRHQLGFAVGERFDPVASERNHANRLTLAQQWHTDHRANPADLSIPLLLIEWIVPRVVDPGDLFCQRSASDNRSLAGRDHRPSLDVQVVRNGAVAGGKSIGPLLLPIDHSLFGAAESHRGVHNALQDGLQLEIGATDDAEDLGSRSLLLQRLLPLAGEPSDLFFLSGSGGTATANGLWPFAAL